MRPLEAVVDLGRIERNYRRLRALHGGRLLAVVKADAFGHGAVETARFLAGKADGFAVAFLEEAEQLRAAGVSEPILALEGPLEARELEAFADLGLWPAIHSPQQLDAFLAGPAGYAPKVWLTLDTGMRRAGFLPDAFRGAYERLVASGKADGVVAMTHLSKADEDDPSFTEKQIAVFDAATAGLSVEASIANTAGIMRHPKARRDWGRAGIGLYGLAPDSRDCAELEPAMTVRSQVVAVKDVKKGEAVSYGGIYIAPCDMRLGMVACGYADGYPRRNSNGAPVFVDGAPSRVAGRVCMDLMMVELNRDSQGVGSVVELWGDNVSVNEIARRADMINYEVVTGYKRGRRRYVVSASDRAEVSIDVL